MSNCKVLVADDVFANQFLLASMLEELSVGFKTVSNGQEVLNELSNDKYDLIFMDIEMPIMNGIEATKQIKNDSRYNKIPVIALTAHDIDEFQGQFTEACFDSIVEKPFTIDSISHVLAKFNFQ